MKNRQLALLTLLMIFSFSLSNSNLEAPSKYRY